MRTSSIISKNYIEIREGMGQQGQWLLNSTEKYGEFGRDEKFSLL
jgi:hypothetical protein